MSSCSICFPSAGTLALLLYSLLTRQISIPSGARATHRLATGGLRSSPLRASVSLPKRGIFIHASAMAKDTLRPIQKVVQGQKMMEGEWPNTSCIISHLCLHPNSLSTMAASSRFCSLRVIQHCLRRYFWSGISIDALLKRRMSMHA